MSSAGGGTVEDRERPAGVLAGCIDVGSNTTRLLVAGVRRGRLAPVCERRAFTRLGSEIRRTGELSPAKLAELAEIVATQVRIARAAGAGPLRVVATAAMRDAVNAGELVEAVRAGAGVEVAILGDEDEARLAFLGATRTHGRPLEGPVAVADVGGGSTELAVGTVAGGVSWWRSYRVGSGLLADCYLRSDPPAAAELQAVRDHVEGDLGGLAVDPLRLAVAVGGSASSLRRLVGERLDTGSLEAGLHILASTPVAEVARRYGLEPERVRILPGGMLLLQVISARLGRALQIGNGGLREGVVLEVLAGAEPGTAGVARGPVG